MSESISKTQYLQTILELSSGDETTKISNNQIAEHLNVTPSSVSNMLAKLQEAGEVDVVPYYGVTLTEPGRQTALRLKPSVPQSSVCRFQKRTSTLTIWITMLMLNLLTPLNVS